MEEIYLLYLVLTGKYLLLMHINDIIINNILDTKDISILLATYGYVWDFTYNDLHIHDF